MPHVLEEKPQLSVVVPEGRETQRAVIGLLGRCDHPTDGVEDYCKLLERSLSPRGYSLTVIRLPWAAEGWLCSIRWLWRQCSSWKSQRVLVQYTSLMWSRRGFAIPWLLVLATLKVRGVRTVLVFHDPLPYPGKRLVDRLRRTCQRVITRCGYGMADKSVLTVPLASVAWLPRSATKATFIPVGANVPPAVERLCEPANGHHTIAVFGITGNRQRAAEVADIAYVARTVARQLPHVRLLTFGRGSLEAAAELRDSLGEATVDYSALGMLPAEEITRVLASSQVALFVRGCLSTQRGSAIASIACGVPLVGYISPPLLGPLAGAGVVGVPPGDREALAAATLKVLKDSQLSSELRWRSAVAFQNDFCWESIATRFVEVLNA